MSKKQNFLTTLLKPLVSHAMLTVSLTVAAIAVIGIATGGWPTKIKTTR